MNKFSKFFLIFSGLILSSILVGRFVKKSSIPLKISQTSALRHLYKLTGTKNLKITSLKGGLSESTLYKIDANNQSYVMRFIGNRSMNDRTREINAQVIAWQAGWGPMVYAFDLNQGWIIMSYIQPTTVPGSDKDNPQTYEKLGDLLQRIHRSSDFLPGKSILTEIEELMNKVYAEGKMPSKIDYSILKNIIQSVKSTYPRTLAPTHRDLNPNNIIFSEHTIFVIDFENAAQDDPLYDVATVGVFYIVNPDHEAVFLNSYFDRVPTFQEYAYYQQMKQLVLIFYGFNFLRLVPQEIIQTTSVIVKPLRDMLEDVSSGRINLADHADQLHLGVSMLQEAINQYNAK